ncbi:retrovirus-related Pol polyprotein from transposon gypsy [Trichonephila clavipes]|nr:retrovirus-related Pol polyprotein from transposon gypsy [Trichonephila clavipes]
MNIPPYRHNVCTGPSAGIFSDGGEPKCGVVKIAFVTKKWNLAHFAECPLGLSSGAAPNFQESYRYNSQTRDEASLFQKPFELFTDASSIGVGAVLNQEQRPVVFASRTLSAAERNYAVTERECLALVWALNKFRTYLGSLPINVITDHAALSYLTTGKNLSNRMIRWALKLAEFNIEWEHRLGTQNTIAAVLSRNPIESIIGEKVNWAIIRALVHSSRDQLIEEQKTDPELGHIYRYLENPEDYKKFIFIQRTKLVFHDG